MGVGLYSWERKAIHIEATSKVSRKQMEGWGEQVNYDLILMVGVTYNPWWQKQNKAEP